MVCLGLLHERIHIFHIEIPQFSLISITLSLILIGLFRFVVQLLNTQSTVLVNENMNVRLRTLSIYTFFNEKNAFGTEISEVNFMLSEIFPKSALYIANITRFLSMFFQCSVILIFMLLTAWKESIIGMFGIGMIGLFTITINNKMKAISNHIPNEQRKLNYGISRILNNILFIKIMKTSNLEHRNLVEIILNYSLKTIRAYFLNAIASTTTPFFGIFLLVFIILSSQKFWYTSPSVLIALLYLLVRFIQNLATLSENFGSANIYLPQFRSAINYYNKIGEKEAHFAMLPANDVTFIGSKKTYQLKNNYFEFSEKSLKSTGAVEFHSKPYISFENVCYTYPNKSQETLKNVSFQIPPGQHLGLIGPSGSGKSTILMLLLGILKPSQGKILINGHPPEEYLETLFSKVGYVGPEPFLIKGTIKENLLYGIKHTVQEEQIWEALKLASLDTFVQKVTLDYAIPEDQSGLSAGQKQRICLARAFLNEPDLLILDEASANLDETTENEIATSILGLKNTCTTIVVSHRPGILQHVDHIIDLKNGYTL